MAERLRFVKIGTTNERIDEYMKQLPLNPVVSKYIAQKDADSVGDALIFAGLIGEGEKFAVSYIPDNKLDKDATPNRAEVYTAYRNEDGKIVPLELIGKFEIDVDYDRDN